MRFLRSKLFISVILLAAAAVLTFYVVPMMYSKQAETIDVVKFVADVNLGTRITENMLQTTTIGRYGTDIGMITNKNAIVGKYAARNISSKEYLYEEMFTDEFEEVEGAAATLIKSGQKLITISISSLAKSVGSQIRPGSVVDIYTKVEEEPEYDEYGNEITNEDETKLELTPLLTGVYVYKVQNSAGEDTAALRRKWQSAINNGEKASTDQGSMIPAVVTLIVSDEQAQLLAQQEYTGIVHMVLYPSVTLENMPDAAEQSASATENTVGAEEQPGQEEIAPEGEENTGEEYPAEETPAA